MKYTLIRNVKSPSYSTDGSAGIDFYIPNDFHKGEQYWINSNSDILIPSGIKMEIPEEYALIAFNKSGIATKKKLIIGACVIDSDYQGEIHLHLFNLSKGSIIINPGEKIAQFILIPIFISKLELVEDIEMFSKFTKRGEKGFGSTD